MFVKMLGRVVTRCISISCKYLPKYSNLKYTNNLETSADDLMCKYSKEIKVTLLLYIVEYVIF